MAVIEVRHEFRGDKTLNELSLWVIPVTLYRGNKKLTIDMLIDTGAERSFIIADYEAMVSLDDSRSIRGAGVVGSARFGLGRLERLEITSIPSVEVEIIFVDVEVAVGQLAEKFRKYQISGLLGADILKMLTLTLNYSEKILTITKKFVAP